MINKVNAYSIIRILVVIAVLYSLVSSLVFSLGGFANIGTIFSQTLSFYIGALVVSYTPKGKMYFTPMFRIAIFILIIVRLFSIYGIYLGLHYQQKYSVLLVFSITAFVFMLLGLITGAKSKNHERRED